MQVHRLDLHARQLQLSEMLPGRCAAVPDCRQVGALEMREAIEALVAGAALPTGRREAFREHITDYLAGALLLPYRRFLRACEATGYDLPCCNAALQREFRSGGSAADHATTGR
jgi:XRE family transcriptional regulator, fatty acid utilization regulator